MAIINLSRQFGSSGDEIALEIADDLGYKHFNKDSLNAYAQQSSQEFKELFSSIGDGSPGVYDYFFNSSKIYNCLIKSFIYDIASQGDVVITGRCGQFILQEFPNVLSVRIIAPLKDRCKNISEYEQIDERLASKLITSIDNERSGFIQYLFNEDIENPAFYDMVFNTSKVGKFSIAKIVVEHAKAMDKKHNHNRERLKALSTTNLVKASITKKSSEPSFFNVESFKPGQIIITGFVKSVHEKEAISVVASKVNGVEELKNDLIVMHKY